jgi:hypothetical protein
LLKFFLALKVQSLLNIFCFLTSKTHPTKSIVHLNPLSTPHLILHTPCTYSNSPVSHLFYVCVLTFSRFFTIFLQNIISLMLWRTSISNNNIFWWKKYVFKVETKHVEKSKQHPKGLYDVLFDNEFVFTMIFEGIQYVLWR